jgi:simple sugar transport system ATP-binding protein
MSNELLVVNDISKSYVGVKALDKVSLTVQKAKIHCLVGENGSGKSTLIKAIAGVIPIDEGEIVINGHPYRYLRAIDSIREGIQVIYQDLSLFPNLTIAENISLNEMIERRKKFLNWKAVKEFSLSELEKIGIHLNVDDLVEDLSMANKQVVAIVRALTQGAHLIIMDEPTTALTKKEIDSLFSIILDLKNQGISTLFVSHKLSEVLEISESVAVLRDGRMVGEFERSELDTDKLVYHMTGKKIEHTTFDFKGKEAAEKPLLEVKHLTKKGNYKDISFTLKSGEVLGITGLLGSGRTELALSLFGLNIPSSGEIFMNGKKIFIHSPGDAIRHGISYLPEDRHIQGLFLDQSIGNNIIATITRKLLNKFGFISEEKKNKSMNRYAEELRIRTPTLDAPAESLSGGNQQRVVLAKWLATLPKIFILDGPTVGIDIASKNEIHHMITSLAEKGIGIIIISDEISEVYHNCNRIIIMQNGERIGEVNARSTTEDELYEMVQKESKSAYTES